MMKHVLLSLLLSSGFAALSVSTAFAQSSPNTTQTDQSEEDWRKSKKKSSTDDPWEDIQNSNIWGQGTQRTTSPVDMLPEDSRRFLMKKRAERLAEAGVGEPVDTSFEPSDAAKSDSNLESDEKDAWSEMMKDMEQGASGSAGGQPAAGDPNGDPNSQTSQSSGSAQAPSQDSGAGGSSSSAPSVMRGGSSASVSDILAQIKGSGSAPSGQSQSGQAPQGQSNNQGQAEQGTAQTDGNAQGQDQADAQNSSNGQSQSEANAASQAQADAKAQTDANAQNQADASAQAAAETAAQAAPTRTPEAISPLDRLKQSSDERASSGTRSSASDYLKRGN